MSKIAEGEDVLKNAEKLVSAAPFLRTSSGNKSIEIKTVTKQQTGKEPRILSATRATTVDSEVLIGSFRLWKMPNGQLCFENRLESDANETFVVFYDSNTLLVRKVVLRKMEEYKKRFSLRFWKWKYERGKCNIVDIPLS